MNLINGQRQSATKIFLDTARVRDNLTIWSETTVDRIIFEGVRAIGVAVLRESRELIVSGNMIILCAGTYCTPTILMRSGIGCSKELEQQGITTVVDLPGVGANLIDHAQCYIAVNATAGTVSYPVPCAQVLLKYSASCMGYTNDMQLSILNWVDLREFSPELVERTSNHSTFMFMVQLEHPLARGKVSLRSSDPNDLPLVELNYCGDVKDIAKLREGIRLSWRILHSPMIKPYVNKIVNIEDHVLAENDLLDRFIRENVLTAHHPMGTSRMGCSSDSLTVVDQYGRVHKTEHLWIADASIIPIALRANTNLTCLAVGEKISDFLKSGLNLE
jgi:choline dehydrogenase